MEKNQNGGDQQMKRSKTECFYFVKNEEGKIVIVCAGMQASRKTFDTFEQAEKYVNSKPYELIFNTFSIMFKLYEDEKDKTTKETAENK